METDLVTVTPEQVTPAMLALFDITKPTMPRAFQVLAGITGGHILVDHPEQPTTVVVQDGMYGTLYFGGNIHAARLATFTCAHLIAACEARGYRTWWDCAKQNTPSVKLAKKLGYQHEPEYRYVW